MINSKILILGKLPPPYIGPTVATEIILNSILREEFDLIHLDTSDHRDINTLGAFDFWNFYLAFKHYLILLWLIIMQRPSLVYLPIGQTSIAYFRDAPFILISKILRRKVVCHLRGSNFKNWYNSLNFIMKYFVRFIHSLVDAQIVLGDNLKQLFAEILPKEKIFVVPNGGNFNFTFKENQHNNKIRILYLANFVRSKGVLDTLKSIKYVFPNFPHSEFVFAGSWHDEKTKKDFESFLKKHPSLPIVYIGPVHGREKYDLLLSSDIFVFPTYYPNEGHPWVIVEAMASGLPIISTDQGAIAESVIDGINGFIVEKQKPQLIAEKIRYLIENHEIRIRMGKESRRLYLEKFTEEKMVKHISQVFRYVLERL